MLLPSSTTTTTSTTAAASTPSPAATPTTAASGQGKGAAVGATPASDAKSSPSRGTPAGPAQASGSGRAVTTTQTSDFPVVLGSALAVLVVLAAAVVLVLRRRRLTTEPSASGSSLTPPLRSVLQQAVLRRKATHHEEPCPTHHLEGGHDRASGRHAGDQHRAGQRRVHVRRGCIDHPAVGADRESTRGRWPTVCKFVGGGDHGREHRRTTRSRPTSRGTPPCRTCADPGGLRRLHPDAERRPR